MQFGVLVIGDEILSGKRQDRHFAHVIDTLRARGQSVAWYRVAADEPRALCNSLLLSQQDCVPVLCFGGIGATPDDNTRQAAAQAFGCQLQLHSEALALIECALAQRHDRTACAHGGVAGRLPADTQSTQRYCRVHTV